MSTPIFTTKKLEKMIQKYIKPKENVGDPGILGKWNATVFYVNRRKNWLLFNPKTHYSVILENITAKDLVNIQEKFREEFFLQLVVDGIDITQKQVDWLVEDLSFHSTDADRSALGYINEILYAIDCHQDFEYYKSLAEINVYLNNCIFSLDGSSKYTRCTKPRDEMGKILRAYIGTERDMPIHPTSLN
ncbi:hypothetical protein [Algoriphagus sp. A40]|uniref:DUF6933 domain-containing protein n=1 Tax=Algoriphagus sp. A40 TaxID=1945863 RepID=UPI0011158997|nr:hypothetical protein [Algoriphagus sp. A40]